MSGEKTWLAISKGVQMGCGQVSVWASQVLPPNSFNHVFIDLALCTGTHHAGTENYFPQTIPTKLQG